MNNKILFLVDHKHRDLPGLSLIGFYLKNIGYKVFYRRVWDTKHLYFDPSIIIIPKANNGSKEFINRCNKWRKSGIKLIVIETEGNEPWTPAKKLMNTVPDLFFFWNKVEQKKHENFLKKNNVKSKVIGSPRLDFFHPFLFKNLNNRKKIINELGINDSLKTITFATNNSYEGLSDENIKLKRKRYSEVYEKCDFDKYLDFMKDVRNTNIHYIKYLAEKFNNYNIILKPHPNENIEFWEDFIRKYPNIKLMIGKNINDLLSVSDLHIGMTICLTITEAKILNIPTIELIPLDFKTDELFQKDHIGLGDYFVDSEKKFDKAILNGLNSAEKQSSINEYISKYYFKFDGKRCKDYAKSIDDYFKGNGIGYINRSIFNKSFHYLYYNLKRIKNYKMNFGERIDKRGRYDNRIKHGDEKEWYQLYQRIL
tara:strand:- start:15886 stop:17160 length:1275 start_codon:yes stop_codon:yes gene_type:complete